MDVTANGANAVFLRRRVSALSKRSRRNFPMNAISILGYVFGTIGFILAIAALEKAGKLEAELKRRGLIDEKSDSEAPNKKRT